MYANKAYEGIQTKLYETHHSSPSSTERKRLEKFLSEISQTIQTKVVFTVILMSSNWVYLNTQMNVTLH